MPDSSYATQQQPAGPSNGPRVDTRHRDYQKRHREWIRCRDVVEGEDAVKDRGVVYLPQLSGTDDAEYQGYKGRAEFYGAANKTVTGLSGMVMRKAPTVEVPAALKSDDGSGQKGLIDHIGAKAEPLDLLVKMALEEVLTTGRAGLYVDAPADVENGLPFVTTWYPENCINWSQKRGPDGRMIFSMIVLKEDAEEPVQGDPFATTCVERYRVLMLEPGEDGQDVYVVKIYEKSGESEDPQTKKKEPIFSLVEEITPTMRGGKRLNFIPFVFIAPSGITGDIEKSPILDLVAVNLSHYRTSADLEHGRHLAALPTLCIKGFDTEANSFKVGPGIVANAGRDQTGANAWYAEFSGAGLGSLEKAQDSKEKRMAILGARLLEGQKSQGVEAAETVKLRTAGEHSVLSNIAKSVSAGITVVLQWMRDWIGASGSGDVSYTLSNDFNATTMDGMFLSACGNAVQSNLMSYQTYFFNLQRGEMYPDGLTADEERKQIEAGAPMPPPAQITAELQAEQAVKGAGGAGGARSKSGENAADVAA